VNPVAQQIREFLIKQFPAAAQIGVHDPLLENGIVDSLGVLDVVGFIEQAFSLTVSDDELVPENFATIERLSEFVESKRNGPPTGN
jgi:acyl carrier protein